MKRSLLLTNDDGYDAPGLIALWRELEQEYETVVVAPSRQRSWIGKALTNPEPLTVERKTIDDRQLYVVDAGTTADCTNLGLYHLAEKMPEIVISGINNGPNFTNSLTLASGTVGGALEAALHGVLGIAVSLDVDAATERVLIAQPLSAQASIFAPAARTACEFLRQWFARPENPRIKLINLVIPTNLAGPAEFIECEPLSYDYGSVFEKRAGGFYNRGRGFIDGTEQQVPGSDVWTVRQGKVAYTCFTGNLERVTI